SHAPVSSGSGLPSATVTVVRRLGTRSLPGRSCSSGAGLARAEVTVGGHGVRSSPTRSWIAFSRATPRWLKVRAMATFGSAHAHPFAGVLDSSAGCGVSKVQLKDSRSTEPSTAFNPPGTLTVKRVANGNGALGTNSTLAEPIHRHSPGSAGLSVA